MNLTYDLAGGGIKRCFKELGPWQPDNEAKEEHSGFAARPDKTGFRARIGLVSSRTDDRAYLPFHSFPGEKSHNKGGLDLSSVPTLISTFPEPGSTWR